MMCLKKKAPGSAPSHAVLDAEYSWRDHGELCASGSSARKCREGAFAPAPQRLQSIEVIRQPTEILKRITIIHNSRQSPACTVYKTTKQLARSTRPEIDCSHSHYKLVPLP